MKWNLAAKLHGFLCLGEPKATFWPPASTGSTKPPNHMVQSVHICHKLYWNWAWYLVPTQLCPELKTSVHCNNQQKKKTTFGCHNVLIRMGYIWHWRACRPEGLLSSPYGNILAHFKVLGNGVLVRDFVPLHLLFHFHSLLNIICVTERGQILLLWEAGMSWHFQAGRVPGHCSSTGPLLQYPECGEIFPERRRTGNSRHAHAALQGQHHMAQYIIPDEARPSLQAHISRKWERSKVWEYF